MVQRLSGVAIVVASITTLSLHVHAQESAMKIGPPENMTRVGSVEERYQSYNIEMLEVTGGMFWKPYGQASNDRTGGLRTNRASLPAWTPISMNTALRSIFRTASFASSQRHSDRRMSA
jgi:heparanase